MRRESSGTGRWLLGARRSVAARAAMAALGLALAAQAGAELRDGMHQVGLDIGGAAPVSKISGANGVSETNGAAGARFGAQYLYHLRPSFAVGLEVSNGIRSTKESSALVTNGITRIKGSSILGLAVGRWTFFDESKLRAFLLGGIGVHRSTMKIETAPQAGFAWSDTGTRESRPIIDGSATGFGGALRLGAEYDVSDPFFAGMDLGWEYMGSSKYKATSSARLIGASDTSGSISHVSFLARIGVRFGG